MIGHIHQQMKRVLQGALILLLAAMALDVLWQVFTRFILGDPSVWTEELARFILIWLGCLGAALGVAEGFHLEMDYFLQKAKGATQKQIKRIIHLVVAMIALLVFIYGGTKLVLLAHSLEQTSPAMGLSMATVYSALPISGLLMLLSCIVHLCIPETDTLEEVSAD